MRSVAFVAFIDPKSNPKLSQLASLTVLAGWVEHRKLAHTKPLQRLKTVASMVMEPSVWRPKLWAVVAKNRLYLFPGPDLSECEPLSSCPIYLCSVEMEADTQVISIERWCVGQTLQLRVAAGSRLDPTVLYRQLRTCNSNAAHARYVRLLTQEDANILRSAVRCALSLLLSVWVN
jgi:hypothetical protein